MSEQKQKWVLIICGILQTLMIPVIILGPMFLSAGEIYSTDSFQYSVWKALTLLIPLLALPAFITIIVWSPLIKQARKRGVFLITQLLLSLLILSPTLWLYGLAKDAYQQQMTLNYLAQIHHGAGLYPMTFSNYFTQHWNLGPGISTATVICLSLVLIFVPAIGCYKYFLSSKRVLGMKHSKIFQ